MGAAKRRRWIELVLLSVSLAVKSCKASNLAGGIGRGAEEAQWDMEDPIWLSEPMFAMAVTLALVVCGAAVNAIDRQREIQGGAHVPHNHVGMGVVSIPWRRVQYCGIGCPLAGLCLCLLLSLQYHFDTVNYTHCKVPNVIPSISACIGDHSPQQYVWRISVALMIGQRILDGFAYNGLFKHALSHRSGSSLPLPAGYHLLRRAHLIIYTAEQGFLVLLSYISSKDNNTLHQIGFGGFAACAVLNPILHCRLAREAFEVDSGNASHHALYSYRWKMATSTMGFVLLSASVLAYVCHNMVCIPYLYSVFAACEWGFVLCNMAFHCSAFLDFGDLVLSLGPEVEEKRNCYAIGHIRGVPRRSTALN